MNAVYQHVLIQILHALLLEEFHFVFLLVRVQDAGVDRVEGFFQVGHIAWFVP